MNLDSYIVRLNEKLEATAQTERFGTAAIERAIHGKATHLAAKVNKAILLEAGSVLVVIMVALLVMLFNQLLWVQLMASMSLLFCLGIGGIYAWKYRQLNRLIRFESNTTLLLHNLIAAVKQFIALYNWALVASIVIGSLIGAIYGMVESTMPVEQTTMPTILTAWYAVPLSLSVIVVLFWATKWYINRLYGKPLKDLERCAAELTNTAE
jgi:hypothetical protein